MKTKKFGLMLVLLLATLIAVFCILNYAIRLQMERPLKLNRYPLTQKLICCVLDNFDELEGVNAQQVNSTIMNQSNSLSINKALLTLMISRTNNFRSLDGFNLTNGVFHDGWGTPLLFALTNNATNSGLAPLVGVHQRPFVVWSAGPNRTNEYGSGDDVIVTGR